MIASFAEYHDLVGYSRTSMDGKPLDWSNRPNVFKSYDSLALQPLPRDVSLNVEPGDESVSAGPGLHIDDLSRILLMAYSITAKAGGPGNEHYFRTVASAGALYPTELYLCATGVEGVEDGVHHFDIARHGLHTLRRGNFAGVGFSRSSMRPGLTCFISVMPFRSAWKYGARSLRYLLLDSGHLADNLACALSVAGLSFRVAYDFDDDAVNNLLCINGIAEVCLAAVQVDCGGVVSEEVSPVEPPREELVAASVCAPRETVFPEIVNALQAGRSASPPVAVAASQGFSELGYSPVDLRELPGADEASCRPQDMDFAHVVRERRSTRNYRKTPMGIETLRCLMSMTLFDPTPVDRQEPLAVQMGFLMAEWGSLPAGLYGLDPSKPAYSLLVPGDSHEALTSACLGQRWMRSAEVMFVFFANMGLLAERHGERGYRRAMGEAGRIGQRIYLASTSLGLGACGIGAFFDWEAADILHLNKDSRLLYLVTAGKITD